MSPNPVVPPPPRPGEAVEIPSTLESILARRRLMYGLFAGFVLAVLLVIVLLVHGYSKRKSRDRAWAALYRTMSEVTAQGDPAVAMLNPVLALQSVDPSLQAREFEQLAEEARGTTAEPYALYYLGNAYLLGHQCDDAEKIFEEIRRRFPHHYLVDSTRYYFTQSLVDKALDDCRIEKEFLEKNPDFLQASASPPAPPEKPKDEEQGAVPPPEESQERATEPANPGKGDQG